MTTVSHRLVFALLLCGAALRAQSTDGLIYGVVTATAGGAPINGAMVRVMSETKDIERDRTTLSSASGGFAFLALPPGDYWLRVEQSGYQPAEVHGLTLPVAGALRQAVELRLLTDTFDQKRLTAMLAPGSSQLVRFYGPDLDFTRVGFVSQIETNVRIAEPSVSSVVDPAEIENLPLLGRDVFNMLATQPAVASDSSTSRSLGLAANGVRPSASSYLVDGFEFNNLLVGGPIAAIPPEAVEEYRISTNGFSAEYGFSAGYVVNAVTRAGTDRWHTTAYTDVKNERLNANDFQNNVGGVPRPKLREYDSGYWTGGRLPRNLCRCALYFSSSGELLSSNGNLPAQQILLPGAGFLQSLAGFPATNPARLLLASYVPPASTPVPGDPFAGTATVSEPDPLSRPFLANRVDAARKDWKFFGRTLDARLSEPDFIWSPYPQFSSGLTQGTDDVSLSASYAPARHTGFLADVRLALARDSIGWDRAHPEIPTLAILSGNPGAESPILPGSPAAYSFNYRGGKAESAFNTQWVRGRQTIKFGGTLLRHTLHTVLPYAASGLFTFSSLASFETGDDPLGIRYYTSFDRAGLAAGQLESPQFDRRYEYLQSAAYVQQSFSWNSRLVTHVGFRLEDYGVPENTGSVKDDLVVLGQGATFPDRIANASLSFSGTGRQPLYTAQNLAAAVRAGFALDLSPHRPGSGTTVLRGGYGIFYDRPVENIWLDLAQNAFAYPSAGILVPNGTNFLNASQTLTSLSASNIPGDFPSLTMIQPHLPVGYVQDLFFRLQHQFSSHLWIDTGLQGSLGRKLLASDVVNRQSLENPQLPEIQYLSSQGDSDYFAWATSLNYKSRHLLISGTYTWSHAIDNQSDPLTGSFFDLSYSSSIASDASSISERPGFSEEFNSRVDRGSADFDQRHNATAIAVWEITGLKGESRWAALSRRWKVSEMAAARSGFPFSVIDQISEPLTGPPLLTRRADLVNPGIITQTSTTGPGGVVLLNRNAFCIPPACQPNYSIMGNTGRNAFYGPGFFSADVSLSREFAIAKWGDTTRVRIRADAYNALNHANLNQPEANLTSGDFGFATYGRVGTSIGFPALAPFRETARQVQLLIRFEF